MPGSGALEYPFQILHIGFHFLQQHVQIRETGGDAGLMAGINKAVPQLSLGFNLHQGFVEVADVNTGTHVLFG